MKNLLLNFIRNLSEYEAEVLGEYLLKVLREDWPVEIDLKLVELRRRITKHIEETED